MKQFYKIFKAIALVDFTFNNKIFLKDEYFYFSEDQYEHGTMYTHGFKLFDFHRNYIGIFIPKDDNEIFFKKVEE